MDPARCGSFGEHAADGVAAGSEEACAAVPFRGTTRRVRRSRVEHPCVADVLTGLAPSFGQPDPPEGADCVREELVTREEDGSFTRGSIAVWLARADGRWRVVGFSAVASTVCVATPRYPCRELARAWRRAKPPEQ